MNKVFKRAVYIYLALITLLVISFLILLKGFFNNPASMAFFVPIGFLCTLVFWPYLYSPDDHNSKAWKRKLKKLGIAIRAMSLYVFISMCISVMSGMAVNMGLHAISEKKYESISLTVKSTRVPYKRHGYYGLVIFKEYSSGAYHVEDEKEFSSIYSGQKAIAEGYKSKYGFELRKIVFK